MKAEIIITPQGYGSKVFLDGTEIKNVRAIDISVSVDTPTALILDLFPHEVVINGEVSADNTTVQFKLEENNTAQ